MKKSFKILLYLSLIVFSALLVISELNLSFISPPEQNSPSDWIKEEQIKVYQDKVIFSVYNPTWAKFTNTNSMDPFLDENAHAIEILPEKPQDIHIGDIISYKTRQEIFIHRVIAQAEDKEGLYFTVKGDNTTVQDPYKVRFEDIQGVVVAIIY